MPLRAFNRADYNRIANVAEPFVDFALERYSSVTQLLLDGILDLDCGQASGLNLLCDGVNVHINTVIIRPCSDSLGLV